MDLVLQLRIPCMGLAAMLAAFTASPAFAQRAAENAVTAASDAFGSSVGDEQIGLYSPYDVRGFSPVTAGNVRIEGLYFDQVAQLNPRVDESSAIRVGIAAQGYAFPAPTGVVDQTLREPGNAPLLSVLSEINPRGTGTLELDGTEPLIDNVLSVGGGLGFHHDVEADGSSQYQNNEGFLVKWTPSPDLEILPFWSRTDFYAAHQGQAYVPAGAFLPINPGRHYFGPDWAINGEVDANYGVLAKLDFLPDWDLRAGLFRSTVSKPDNFYVQLTGVSQAGAGELNVIANPPSNSGSTSGEVRLEHVIEDGPRVQRAIVSVRIRDWSAVYGGAEFLDLGPAVIGQRLDLPKSQFQFGPQTDDHITETTVGFSYQLAWSGLGILGLTAQRPNYRKETLIPGFLPAISQDEPWFLNAALAIDLSPSLVLYGDATRGLEDNGIAPQNASNSNQALPAITTRQKDLGARWKLTSGLNLVAGVFDIHKPYFNLNPGNLYTRLGDTENKGIELSLTGHVLPNLDLIGGAVLSEPRVTGEAVNLDLVGARPVGISPSELELDANWRPPETTNLSLDLDLSHQTRMPSTIDDAVSIPDRNFVSGDIRYAFTLGHRSASLRLWLENLLGENGWDLNDADTYNIYWNSGRRIDLRLIVDI
ncbi:MAG: TonB-dependent receptor domain-containing protein [Rhizomicrobium sp.]